MIKEFVTWYNKLPEFQNEPCQSILEDAIKCFKFDMPRPAFLLTHLAFMHAVKYNLLKMSVPDGYHNDQEWERELDDMFSDKAMQTDWEIKLDKYIVKNKDTSNPYKFSFDLPDKIKDDYNYWKRIRNDCAHYNSTIISLETVVTYWQFIMSKYLLYFVPQGGIQRCIDDYIEQFDEIRHDPEEDTSKLFWQLENSIQTKEDVKQFAFQLYDKCNNSKHKRFPKNLFEIIQKLIKCSTKKQQVCDFLISEKGLSTEFLNEYPNLLMVVFENTENLREYCFSNIWTCEPSQQLIQTAYNSICTISTECNTFVNKMMLWMYNKNRYYTIDNIPLEKLFKEFATYFNYVFIKGKPNNIDFYTSFFIQTGVIEEIANKFISELNNDCYISYWLRDTIIGEFDSIKWNDVDRGLQDNMKTAFANHQKKHPA